MLRSSKLRQVADNGIYAVVLALVCALGTACSTQPKLTQSAGHIAEAPQAAPPADIPPPVTQAPVLPPPKPQARLETYTVIVNQVPLKELLFALARDARLNLDIYDDIEGTITINAVDQTLPQILERISRQAAIRYRIEGDHLTVSADTPYLHTYKIPYVNMSRDSVGQINLSTQIAAAGTVAVGNTGGGGSAGGNNSTLSVINNSSNDFWRTLFHNVRSIIRDTAQGGGSGNELTSSNVTVNRESGLISVNATSKQHAEVQSFIDKVVNSAQRQVLIEATVAEITLSKTFRAGIDWSRISAGDGTSASQNLLGFTVNPTNIGSTPGLVVGYRNARDGYDIMGSLRLLEEFGDVSVLSSPKLMVLNNQTSILKVVDNRVYFTVDVTETTNENTTRVTFETEIHTVPVGLVMSLIPYVSETDEVILNIRPTISRILQFIPDPNPTLAAVNTESLIPEIQVREMESMLRLTNGQVGIIGGLMQNSVDKQTDSVPGISKVPVLGEAFKSRNNEIGKTELVIFLRATVVREPGLEADLKSFKPFLPQPDKRD